MAVDDPAWSLQRGVLAALRASGELAEFVGKRIYDEPPDAADFPYIRLGNVDLTPLRFSCGTDHEFLFSIEVHSRPVDAGGRVEATRIAGLVRRVLDDPAPVVLPDFTLDWIFYLTQSVSRAADGRSHVVVIGFRAAVSDPNP